MKALGTVVVAIAARGTRSSRVRRQLRRCHSPSTRAARRSSSSRFSSGSRDETGIEVEVRYGDSRRARDDDRRGRRQLPGRRLLRAGPWLARTRSTRSSRSCPRRRSSGSTPASATPTVAGSARRGARACSRTTPTSCPKPMCPTRSATSRIRSGRDGSASRRRTRPSRRSSTAMRLSEGDDAHQEVARRPAGERRRRTTRRTRRSSRPSRRARSTSGSSTTTTSTSCRKSSRTRRSRTTSSRPAIRAALVSVAGAGIARELRPERRRGALRRLPPLGRGPALLRRRGRGGRVSARRRRRPRRPGLPPIARARGAECTTLDGLRRRARERPSNCSERPDTCRETTERGHGRPRSCSSLRRASSSRSLLLPLAYLVVRVASGGRRARHPRRVVDAGGWSGTRSLLAVGVVVASTLVAVPMAWLVTRTDLPARRLWAAATAVPLVIPSYVAAFCLLGFFGPRGVLARARSASSALPDVTGYWGALARADARDLSVRLPARPQAALREPRPRARRGGARPRASRTRGCSSGSPLPALRPAVGLGALLVVLYVALGLRRGLAHGLRHADDARSTSSTSSLFDRAPAAILALRPRRAHGRRPRARRVPHPAARSPLPGTPGAARPHAVVPLGRWRHACARLLRPSSSALPRPSGRRARLLARARYRERPELGRPVERDAALARGVGGWRPVVAVVAALPVALLALRYPTAHVARARAALVRGRTRFPGIVIALSLVFFAARYASPVYQTHRAPGLRVRHPLLPAGAARASSRRSTRVNPRSRRRRGRSGAGPLRTLGSRDRAARASRESSPAPRSSS